MQATKVILAGGESRRMGYQDKTWLQYQGKYFVDYVADAFIDSAIEGPLLLSRARSNQPADPALISENWAIIDDGAFVQQGPLAGIYAGLCHAIRANRPGPVLFMPVDAIGITGPIIRSIYQHWMAETATAVALQQDNNVNPVCCILHTSSINSVRQALFSERFGVYQWMNSLKLSTIAIPSDVALSVNTLSELHQLVELPCTKLS